MKQYIVQYYNKFDGRWDFTGRVFDLPDEHPLYVKQAWESVQRARQDFPENKWRLVHVEITVVDGQL